jgi:hypothetical protein
MLSPWTYGEDVRFTHFVKGALAFTISEERMMADFNKWLRTGIPPYYVNWAISVPRGTNKER